MLNEVGAIERHLEEEPQRRDGGIDLGCARPARRQMQAIAPYVLRLGRGRRAFKERGEVLDPLHVVMLGLRCELADRHVFDHAPTQRADGLLGHGDAPVLSEVVQTPRSQDRTLRPAMVLAVPPAAALYRASGLVLWPNSAVKASAGHGSYQWISCRPPDINADKTVQ